MQITKPSESKSSSTIENRQTPQTNSENTKGYRKRKVIHQHSKPDTYIMSKKIKDITYCDRNIMGSFEIKLRLDELR